MPFELTPEQATFLFLLVGLMVPIFQAIKRLAAIPVIYRALAWIYAKFKWLPGTSNDWQRITVGLLSIVATWLFQQPSLPAFPATAAAFSLAYATEILTWATSVLALGTLFVAWTHVIFHWIGKKVFVAAAKAEIPVVEELAPAAIKLAVAEAKA